MAAKLVKLLDDDVLRRRFSEEAKREIAENGHIDRMCAGFRGALSYAEHDSRQMIRESKSIPRCAQRSKAEKEQ